MDLPTLPTWVKLKKIKPNNQLRVKIKEVGHEENNKEYRDTFNLFVRSNIGFYRDLLNNSNVNRAQKLC